MPKARTRDEGRSQQQRPFEEAVSEHRLQELIQLQAHDDAQERQEHKIEQYTEVVRKAAPRELRITNVPWAVDDSDVLKTLRAFVERQQRERNPRVKKYGLEGIDPSDVVLRCELRQVPSKDSNQQLRDRTARTISAANAAPKPAAQTSRSGSGPPPQPPGKRSAGKSGSIPAAKLTADAGAPSSGAAGRASSRPPATATSSEKGSVPSGQRPRDALVPAPSAFLGAARPAGHRADTPDSWGLESVQTATAGCGEIQNAAFRPDTPDNWELWDEKSPAKSSKAGKQARDSIQAGKRGSLDDKAGKRAASTHKTSGPPQLDLRGAVAAAGKTKLPAGNKAVASSQNASQRSDLGRGSSSGAGGQLPTVFDQRAERVSQGASRADGSATSQAQVGRMNGAGASAPVHGAGPSLSHVSSSGKSSSAANQQSRSFRAEGNADKQAAASKGVKGKGGKEKGKSEQGKGAKISREGSSKENSKPANRGKSGERSSTGKDQKNAKQGAQNRKDAPAPPRQQSKGEQKSDKGQAGHEKIPDELTSTMMHLLHGLAAMPADSHEQLAAAELDDSPPVTPRQRDDDSSEPWEDDSAHSTPWGLTKAMLDVFHDTGRLTRVRSMPEFLLGGLLDELDLDCTTDQSSEQTDGSVPLPPERKPSAQSQGANGRRGRKKEDGKMARAGVQRSSAKPRKAAPSAPGMKRSKSMPRVLPSQARRLPREPRGKRPKPRGYQGYKGGTNKMRAPLPERDERFGYVIVCSESAAEFFLTAPVYALRCRSHVYPSVIGYLQLQRSSRGRGHVDRVTAERHIMHTSSLQVVDAEKNQVLYESGLGIMFEIRAASRVIAIHFHPQAQSEQVRLASAATLNQEYFDTRCTQDYQYAVETFIMNLLSPTTLQVGSQGEWVLNILLRHFPRLYRAGPPSHDAFVTQIRTTDFTDLHAFGFPCSNLRIVTRPPCIHHNAENRILEVLAACGIHVNTLPEPQVLPSLTTRGVPWDLRLEEYLREKVLCGELPFSVSYALATLVHDGRIHSYYVNKTLINALNSVDPAIALAALSSVAALAGLQRTPTIAAQQRLIKGPAAAVRSAVETLAKELPTRSNGCPAPDGAVALLPPPGRPGDEILVRRVMVTPLRVVALPPESERSNRILRRYHHLVDRFVRVNFVDEQFNFMFNLNAAADDVCDRVRAILRDGLPLAGRHFRFLAYGASQLREHACWFYSDDPDPADKTRPPSADEIRRDMGDFDDIDVAGKYAARMGQCFSSTIGTVRVEPHERCKLPEIWDAAHHYAFSDGVGVIAPEVAEVVAKQLPSAYYREHVPCAFQIRLGGSKGVLAVWPSSYIGGKKIGTRESMDKFPSDSSHLEVCETSRRLPFFLNRQAIFVLLSLGIPERVFDAIYRKTVRDLDRSVLGGDIALKVLNEGGYNSSGSALETRFHPSMADAYDMIKMGLSPAHEPYLHGLLHAFRARKLQDIQERARMPVKKAVTLIGIMDETATLPPGTIYFQCRDPLTGEVSRLPPRTRVAVCRNPGMHPGDLRVLVTADSATLPPELSAMVDVVVFPQRGERPHASEMGGGDLDGDLFFIIWDETLVPFAHVPPMSYLDVKPNRRPGGRVTIDDICDFFVDFIRSNNLGEISNTHLAIADKSPKGVKDPRCVELAVLYSQAVDFPKSGNAVPRNALERYKRGLMYPDFMEKLSDQTYESDTVVGRIYRAAKAAKASALPAAHALPHPHIDPRLVMPGHEAYMADAKHTLSSYRADLYKIMMHFGVFNEAEVLSGHVLAFSRTKNNRSRQADFQARLNTAIERLRFQYHKLFWQGLEHEGISLRAKRKASAWYKACYEAKQQKIPVLSFPWIVLNVLSHVKEDNARGSARGQMA